MVYSRSLRLSFIYISLMHHRSRSRWCASCRSCFRWHRSLGLCLSHLLPLGLVRCLEDFIAPLAAAISVSQASAAAFKSGIESVRRILRVCEEFCALASELRLSACSAAEFFCGLAVYDAFPVEPSSQQVMIEKSSFDQFPGSFGECTPGSLVTPLSGLSFLLVTLSGKTLTVNDDPGLLVSELLDKIAEKTGAS